MISIITLESDILESGDLFTFLQQNIFTLQTVTSPLSAQVGGFNGITQLRSVIAYDPRTRHWRNVAPMLHPRKNFGIAVLEDQLYVVGGFYNGGLFCNLECYDEKTNRWYIVSDKGMTQGAVSCCVLKRHPDLTAYLP